MTLEQLAHERAIHHIVRVIAMAMDRRDWAALDHFGTDDAIADFGDGRIEPSAISC